MILATFKSFLVLLLTDLAAGFPSVMSPSPFCLESSFSSLCIPHSNDWPCLQVSLTLESSNWFVGVNHITAVPKGEALLSKETV